MNFMNYNFKSFNVHACMPCRMASTTAPPVFEHAECRDDEDERELLLAPRSDSIHNPLILVHVVVVVVVHHLKRLHAITLNSRYPKAIIGMLLLVVVLYYPTLTS